MSNEKLGTVIHGIGSHESLDSSGERIEIKGIDISSLTTDGVINVEHESKQTSQIIGKILEATKILKKEDCKNKHHEYFWDKGGKIPYLYIKAVLFDQFGHTGAIDAVAMLKFDEAMDKDGTRQLAGFSVEGSRLDKDGALIKKCIARKMSFTLFPCNKACVAEILNPEKEDKKKLISLEDLKLAFKKSQEMEIDLIKAEGKYNLGLSHKLTPQSPSSTRNYSKISAGHGESRPAKPMAPKMTLKPSQIAPNAKLTVGTRIEHTSKKPKTGASIYKDPNTWKSEMDTMSNKRKAMIKHIKKSNSTSNIKTQVTMSEKTMKRKELLKSISEEAFQEFPHKEELLASIKKAMPKAGEKEIQAIANTYAYREMKKAEIQLADLADDSSLNDE